MSADPPDHVPATVPQPRREDAPHETLFSPARLRAWRHLRDVTHTQLANAAGTTVAFVQACEHGNQRPGPAEVIEWAGVLGCRPDQLRSATPGKPGEYWKAANEAMGPMSTQDLAVVADVILRSRAHRVAQDRTTAP